MPSRIGQWSEVAGALSADIAAGRLAPGARLPTEAMLAARFGVGRHSVRRAVSALTAAGALRVLQGSGTYVADRAPLIYRIDGRTRFRRNLLVQGIRPSDAILEAVTVVPPDDVARALALAPGARAHRTLTLGKADEAPISLSTAWYPADRLPRFLQRRRAGEGVSEAYAAHGVPDYRRRDTSVTARIAEPTEARLLAMPHGDPVLVVVKTDVDGAGAPIGHARVIWPAERVLLTIDTEPTRPLQD